MILTHNFISSKLVLGEREIMITWIQKGKGSEKVNIVPAVLYNVSVKVSTSFT
jgi:hypothetical protein